MTNSDLLPILVVEDNEANMKFLLFILKRLGPSFEKAYSGEEAIDILEKQQFRCMLLDINLGDGISGLELMEIVRKYDRYKDIPIIAVTAYFGDNFKTEILAKGFTNYISKPYVYSQLKDMLDKYHIH